MKKHSLIKGTIILGMAGIFARFLGLFFRIPIQALIKDEGMGYYQMSYPLYMFFVAVASGVPIAMSKLIAEMNAKNDREGAGQVLRQTLIFMIILGSVFTTFMIMFARPIISLLKWDSKSYYAFLAIAAAPIFVSIMCTFRGFFQGLQNVRPTAISQIIEQVGRVVAGVFFAYLLFPKGIEYAAGGAALGTLVGAIMGSIYLVSTYFKVIREIPVRKKIKHKHILGDLGKAAIPISLGAAVGTIMSLIDSVLVPQQLLKAGFSHLQSAVMYGQLTGKAFTLMNVPLALSVALCASLVPIIAEAFYLGRRRELIKRVDMAVKLSNVISLPSALGMFFMAYPIMHLVFMRDAAGYEILKYISICIPFVILTQTSTAILQSIGNYMKPVYNLALGCIVKVIVTYILVSFSFVNIYGAVIGTILGYITSCLLNMHVLKKSLNIKFNKIDAFVKPAIAAIIMIVAVVFSDVIVYNYTMSGGLSCIISILIGVIVYLIFIFLLRVFEYQEIKNKFLNKK
ncbi:polysaccharide biosynthesis protein [Clostridium estertheticum]|uniref:putative polysaccharide biosynthesis protein n=1 Tax=Clostridium estertheticum TaxID=238834 RepID=UPI001CF13C9D|nr:polysaccharide biosynthesis protein [Clostridium estertheticum]MCB2356205.1 polysaccharide biosynthesis protein [Clostridium estertheticum]WAG41388.1 polysaccharide biosynthesis protein [Clostridium estertheticum]